MRDDFEVCFPVGQGVRQESIIFKHGGLVFVGMIPVEKPGHLKCGHVRKPKPNPTSERIFLSALPILSQRPTNIFRAQLARAGRVYAHAPAARKFPGDAAP
jgi:hypothetical protein